VRKRSLIFFVQLALMACALAGAGFFDGHAAGL
jgi:hypothetical protein